MQHALSQPRLVIVGAGLGGCVLAQALLEHFDITLIERGAQALSAQTPIKDIGWPAQTEPHVASGLGGTTQLWHNGLIEIDEAQFTSFWPIQKETLAAFYEQAFELLSGVPRERIQATIAELQGKYRQAGLPSTALPGLFYPRWPLNTWTAFQLEGRVRLLQAEAIDFEVADDQIKRLVIEVAGQRETVEAEHFVLAAGGLATPLLLQQLRKQVQWPGLAHAGCHYEDHPMAFVGEVKVTAPLYKLWNYHVAGTGGNLRMPIVLKEGDLDVSYQLRPAASYYRSAKRNQVSSVLNELRRQMWNPLHYFKLLRHWDDILDILSFKFGIRIPTKHYTILMVAQMPTADALSVWSDCSDEGRQDLAKPETVRDWQLPDAYIERLHRSLQSFLAQLAPITKSARVFPNWPPTLRSAAHHSGTARMSASPERGVCDGNLRVHGAANLYVCDGSAIPASGIANTGLTIAALALRLADHLKAKDSSAC